MTDLAQPESINMSIIIGTTDRIEVGVRGRDRYASALCEASQLLLRFT